MDYLPERRRDFTGPRDAAAAWRPIVEKLPWRQKPVAVGFAMLAVALASARRIRRVV